MTIGGGSMATRLEPTVRRRLSKNAPQSGVSKTLFGLRMGRKCFFLQILSKSQHPGLVARAGAWGSHCDRSRAAPHSLEVRGKLVDDGELGGFVARVLLSPRRTAQASASPACPTRILCRTSPRGRGCMRVQRVSCSLSPLGANGAADLACHLQNVARRPDC